MCVAGCLRQRGQPAVVESRGPAAGDGDAGRAWAEPWAHIRPSADRERLAGTRLGKRAALVFEALRFRRDGPPELDIKLGLREIVGVVEDVKHSKLQQALGKRVRLDEPQSAL